MQSVNIQKCKKQVPKSPEKMHVTKYNHFFFFLIHLDKMPRSISIRPMDAPII